MVDTRLFGPEGYFTKKIKKQSTNTKSQKAKVEKQRQAQKKKTFVPGTQDQRPVSTDKGPNMNQINRPSQSEQYKNKPQPQAKVTKVKTYRATEAGTDYPVYDSKPSTTTTPSYTKKTDTPKAGDMEEGKKKMKGDTSLARQAMKNAQGLLKRPTRNR
jgi:hypothetical protein